LQASKLRVVTLLAAGLALSACAGGLPANLPGAGSAPGSSGTSGSSGASASSSPSESKGPFGGGGLFGSGGTAGNGGAPATAGAPANAGASAAGSAPASDADSDAAPAAANAPRRDLSAAEKKLIMDQVQYNLKDPQTAKYHWTKFAVTPDPSGNYCATVDAKSPYQPYNGRQAYIMNVTIANGQIVGATMGLIAGGKDAAIVAKTCAKYGLNPNN
jgi:hypothetical protein